MSAIIIAAHYCYHRLVPGAQASRPQAHEDGADELAERGRVDRVQFLLLAVPQIVIVQGAAREAHSLGRLVVVQQPLQLWAGEGGHGAERRARVRVEHEDGQQGTS